MFQEELKKNHQMVYKVLENALKHNRLAHAYMFVGETTAPKKESAYLLAQSLVCKKDGFACETCDSCMRVTHNNYADMIYLDGLTTSIKKEDILRVKEAFSKTNIESKGKKIYVLDGAEYATISALNSLLTFLEEPGSQTIAILLVENPDQILDTIKSRCQIITFQKQNKEDTFKRFSKEYDILDAYILSYLGISEKKLVETMECEEYQHAQYTFKTYIEKYLKRYQDANVFLQIEGFGKNKLDGKLVCRYFLDMLGLLAKDVLIEKHLDNAWYQSMIDLMSRKQAQHILSLSNRMKDRNIKSVNLGLLIDQFIYEMGEFDE